MPKNEISSFFRKIPGKEGVTKKSVFFEFSYFKYHSNALLKNMVTDMDKQKLLFSYTL